MIMVLIYYFALRSNYNISPTLLQETSTSDRRGGVVLSVSYVHARQAGTQKYAYNTHTPVL